MCTCSHAPFDMSMPTYYFPSTYVSRYKSCLVCAVRLFKEQDSSRANSGQVGLIGVWKTNLDMIPEIFLQQSQVLIDHIT